MAHAFSKINGATIPAQTPVPRKDMVLDTMSGSAQYSAINLISRAPPLCGGSLGLGLYV